MRTKVTLVLVFLNVTLCFFIVHARHRWSIEEAAAAASHRVFPPEASNIQSLTLAVPGGSFPVKLVLQGKNWNLASPLDWPANPNAVDHILYELQNLEYQHPPFAVEDLRKSGQSLADYGLDHPALTLTFTAGTSNPPTTFLLRLGTTTALDNQLYILSPDGTQVEVVERSLLNTLQLGLDLNQLCSRAIFNIPPFEARELSLQGLSLPDATAARIRLHRDGARWSFESPIVTRADKAATDLAIGSLTALNVVRFLNELDAPPERTGLPASPVLRVNLLGNNRQETLLLGRAVTESPASAGPPGPRSPGAHTLRFAKLEERDPLFVVDFPDQLLTDLDHAQETLRDHRVFDFDLTTVTAITLTAPGQPNLLLQRLESPAGSAAAWQIARPAGLPPLPADHDLVQFLLDRLSLLSATRFVSDAPTPAELETWGFNRPEREVTLTLAPAPAANPPAPFPTTTLSLQVAHTNTADYARVAGETFIYAVPASTLYDLPVAARVYRDRTVRELPAGAQITGFALTVIGGDTAPIYHHQLAAGETWAMALAGESPGRWTALTAMLEGEARKDAPKPALLRKLRAKQFVADEYSDTAITDGQVRAWKYRLDLTIALTGGAAGAQTITSTLFLAQRSGGGTQLAASPKGEANVVFELEQPLVDALFALTNGARDPGPNASAPAVAPPSLGAK
jgi:hypothetical protein